MAKFKLEANPTFKATVALPIHGGKDVPVEFEFKHRTRKQMDAWMKDIKGKTDIELLEDVLAGWALDDAFTKENMELLAENFAGAPREIVTAYIDNITQARKGN